MESYELDNFVKDLDILVSFFSEMAAKEDELLAFGIHRATKWETYAKAKELFIDFDSRIFELLQFAHIIDRGLGTSIQALIDNSKIADSIGKLSIQLRIEEMKKSSVATITIFKNLMSQLSFLSKIFPRKKLFAEELISIQNILVTLHRLISLIKRLEVIYYNKWRSDDDIFKPSNLDHSKIIVLIDNALTNIEQSSILPPNEIKRLIEYLNSAKNELASSQPSWNKIVGTLLIVAALISGIADLPKAISNVNTAITYILEGSVERRLLPAIPFIDQKIPKDSHDTQSEIV